MNKKGFTLVELSIVLVIIGLLIGGILVAQSMIETARVSRTVSLLSQFDAVALTYKSQYNYLPGDNPSDPPNDVTPWGGCGTGVSNGIGMGDGIIDGGCFMGNNIAGHYHGGLKQFWHIISGRTLYYILEPFHLYASSGSKQNTYAAPVAKKGSKVGFWVGCTGSGNNCIVNASRENYYAIVETAPWSNVDILTVNPTVTPANSLALDLKLDDGKANSGYVLSGNISLGIRKTPVSANCSTGENYNLAISDYACIPIIKLGAMVGGNI